MRSASLVDDFRLFFSLIVSSTVHLSDDLYGATISSAIGIATFYTTGALLAPLILNFYKSQGLDSKIVSPYSEYSFPSSKYYFH